LTDDTLLQEHVEHARGSFARPLTDEELFSKVEMLVEPRLGPGVAQSLSDAVRTLETSASLDALVALTIPRASVAHV
jgi:hypothetical protein